jgi:NAD+ kinase
MQLQPDLRQLLRQLANAECHVRDLLLGQQPRVGKAHDEELIKHSCEVTDWLLTKDASYTVYVEQTLEDNKIFDAASLLAKNPSYEGRIKFWTNRLCAQKPQTFLLYVFSCFERGIR